MRVKIVTMSLITAAILGIWGVAVADNNKPAHGTSASGAGKQSSTSAQQSADASRSQGAQAAVPVVVLVPMHVATDQNFGNGCWARFYEDTGFRGDQLTLVGPVDLPEMRGVAGGYGGGLDSVIVGPKARVVTYDNEHYRDRTATLNPGQRIADLGDAKLGLFEDIESVRVTCSTT